MASIAYIDPGNFAANFEGSTRFGYELLGVLMWSNAMAILIQYLSNKLGIATDRTRPENRRLHFSRPATVVLWIAAEFSALATDLAEFLGAARGFHLLIARPPFGRRHDTHQWPAADPDSLAGSELCRPKGSAFYGVTLNSEDEHPVPASHRCAAAQALPPWTP